jgi:hypothetical protein
LHVAELMIISFYPADFETADALTAAVSQVRPEDWTYCGRMF